jgi:hypothetical protein
MVAYSYKGRFVAPIRVGLGLPVMDLHYELGGYIPGQPIRPKRQTIRAIGQKRHALANEAVQLYHAQRSPKCFKIGEAICTAADDIRLHIRSEIIEIRRRDRSSELIDKPCALDSFARKDGFEDWADMRAFWLAEHDGKQLGPFCGVLIEWKPR